MRKTFSEMMAGGMSPDEMLKEMLGISDGCGGYGLLGQPKTAKELIFEANLAGKETETGHLGKIIELLIEQRKEIEKKHKEEKDQLEAALQRAENGKRLCGHTIREKEGELHNALCEKDRVEAVYKTTKENIISLLGKLNIKTSKSKMLTNIREAIAIASK